MIRKVGMITVILFLCVATATIASALEGAKKRVISSGESDTIVPGFRIGDVAVANRALVDFVVGGSREQVVVTGKRDGETQLTLWDDSGKLRETILVQVVPMGSRELMQQAQSALSGVSGIHIRIRGADIIIEGETLEPEHLRQVQRFCREHAQVLCRTKMAEDVQRSSAELIERMVATPGIRARGIGDEILLDGVAYSKAAAQRAEEIAKQYSENVRNVIEVRDRDRRPEHASLVQVDVHILEIKQEALRRFGIFWTPGSVPKNPSSASSGIVGDALGAGQQALGFVLNFLPKLRTARELGLARIVEHVSMVVKNGERGEIFSGTEMPYLHREETQFKEVGMKVQAEPIVAPNGVDLKIIASVSTPSAHLEGGVDRHSISTIASCPEGQTMVIGNVLREREVRMRNRLPKNADVSSALFSISSGRERQSDKAELIIFVTPRVLQEPPSAQRQWQRWLDTQTSLDARWSDSSTISSTIRTNEMRKRRGSYFTRRKK